jgi:hypothetical protein
MEFEEYPYDLLRKNNYTFISFIEHSYRTPSKELSDDIVNFFFGINVDIKYACKEIFEKNIDVVIREHKNNYYVFLTDESMIPEYFYDLYVGYDRDLVLDKKTLEDQFYPMIKNSAFEFNVLTKDGLKYF